MSDDKIGNDESTAPLSDAAITDFLADPHTYLRNCRTHRQIVDAGNLVNAAVLLGKIEARVGAVARQLLAVNLQTIEAAGKAGTDAQAPAAQAVCDIAQRLRGIPDGVYSKELVQVIRS